MPTVVPSANDPAAELADDLALIREEVETSYRATISHLDAAEAGLRKLREGTEPAQVE